MLIEPTRGQLAIQKGKTTLSMLHISSVRCKEWTCSEAIQTVVDRVNLFSLIKHFSFVSSSLELVLLNQNVLSTSSKCLKCNESLEICILKRSSWRLY